MPKAKHLSKTVIDALKPAAVRYEQPDLGERGLYLVVQPSGHKSWALRYRFDGRTKKLTIKEYPTFGVDEARKAARQAKEMAKKDVDPAEQKKEQRADKRAAREADVDTFAGVARLFIHRYAKPKNRTWMEQARLLGLAPDPAKPESADDPRTYIALPGRPAALLSKKPFRALAAKDVHAVIEGIIDRGAAVGSNRVRAVMNRMFEWAVNRPDIAIELNPVARIDKQPEATRERVLSHDELRLVWLAAERIGYPFGPIFQLLLLTSQRLGEVSGIPRSEISRDGRTWLLPAARSKNKIGNEIPLTSPATAIISALPAVDSDKGFLFTTTGRTPVSGFSKAKAHLERAMVEILTEEMKARGEDASVVAVNPWRLHDIRHTVDTIMHDELNVAPHIVEAVLHHVSGHKAGVAGRYNHAKYRVQKAQAYDLWTKHLADIVAQRVGENVTPLREMA